MSLKIIPVSFFLAFAVHAFPRSAVCKCYHLQLLHTCKAGNLPARNSYVLPLRVFPPKPLMRCVITRIPCLK